jgi:hypothetical protein
MLVVMNESTLESDAIDQEIVNSDQNLGETPEAGSTRTRKGKRVRGEWAGDFLPAARVGKLLTVDAWLLEYGKVYRAVRRGEISTQDGAKLAYMAMTGKQLAEARQQLIELEMIRRQLADIRGGQASAVELLSAGDDAEACNER